MISILTNIEPFDCDNFPKGSTEVMRFAIDNSEEGTHYEYYLFVSSFATFAIRRTWDEFGKVISKLERIEKSEFFEKLQLTTENLKKLRR